jgi:exoribonuclease R
VHRLLAASLDLSRLPEDARDRDKLHGLAGNLNLRHRNAQMAGRASVELHTLIFFKDRTVIADARITKVRVPACIHLPQVQVESRRTLQSLGRCAASRLPYCHGVRVAVKHAWEFDLWGMPHREALG